MRFAWCGHTCIAADQVQPACMPLQPPVCALLLCRCLLCPLYQHGLEPYFCGHYLSVMLLWCNSMFCPHLGARLAPYIGTVHHKVQFVACNVDLSALPRRLCRCHLQSLLHNGHREAQTLLSRLQVQYLLTCSQSPRLTCSQAINSQRFSRAVQALAGGVIRAA